MSYNEKLTLELTADNEMSDKIIEAIKSVKNLNEETEKLGSVADKSAEESKSGFNKFISSVQDGIDKVQDFSEKVNSFARQYNTMMGGVNRGIINLFENVGDAIFDFTADSIDNFTNLSEQHAKTLGAMANNYDKTAESQKKFLEDSRKLKDQAIELGTYGPNGQGALTNATGVSELQTELVKAGMSANDILKGGAAQSVLQFAQANDLSSSDAVEFAVQLGNQFNIKPKNWGRMLDEVSHTADLSIIDVKDIIASMKYASGISSGVGNSLEETLGMTSILGNFGLKGSQSGSSIQALITRMLTGDTTVITDAQAKIAPPKALDAFYQFEKIAKPNGELLPMDQVVDQLDDIMGGLNDSEQAWFAKRLFGLYQMKGAYALLNGDNDALDDIIGKIKDESEGTNSNKLSQILESQYGKLESLNTMYDSVKTDMGDRLSPLVTAIRDELYNFLSNKGNYNINFDNLRTALDKSADLIEERYGTALADAVRNIGGLSIDLSEVVAQIAPDFAAGILDVINSAIKFDIPSTIGGWNDMISDMKESVKGLPENLQNMGTAVTDVIDLFGKLAAFNVVMQGLEGASNLSILLTNISTAGTTLVSLLGGVPAIGIAVGAIAAVVAVDKAADSATGRMDQESVLRNVFQFDKSGAQTEANSKITTGMNATYEKFLSNNNIKAGSDISSLLMFEMQKYVYEQNAQGKHVTTDQYSDMLTKLYGKYTELVSGGSGYVDILGKPLNAGTLDNTTFSGGIYKMDKYGNVDMSSKTTVYSELYDWLVDNVPGMKDQSRSNSTSGTKTSGSKSTSTSTYDNDDVAGFTDSGTTVDTSKPKTTEKDNSDRKLIEGEKDVSYDDNSISFWDRLGAAFSKDAWKYGYNMPNGSTLHGGDVMAGLWNVDQLMGYQLYNATGAKGWWYNGNKGSSSKGDYDGSFQEYSDAINQGVQDQVSNALLQGINSIDWENIGINKTSTAKSSNTNQALAERYGIKGWAAMSDNGLADAVADAVQHENVTANLQFSPAITLQPPSVNVDVKVDKDGNASKNISILDPRLNFNNYLNQWYNKSTSQYGSTSK